MVRKFTLMKTPEIGFLTIRGDGLRQTTFKGIGLFESGC